MLKKITTNKILTATIIHVIVAFFYITSLVLTIDIFFKEDINKVISIVDLVEIKENNITLKDVKLNKETNTLESYPAYGAKYAKLSLPTLDLLDLPVYFGDTMEILRLGVGHSASSYFPGEGGTILYMGHNADSILKYLKDIKINDLIFVETTYGKFIYQVYDYKIIEYTDTNEVAIQSESEELILYTCYRTSPIGHATKRFVAYTKLVQKELF